MTIYKIKINPPLLVQLNNQCHCQPNRIWLSYIMVILENSWFNLEKVHIIWCCCCNHRELNLVTLSNKMIWVFTLKLKDIFLAITLILLGSHFWNVTLTTIAQSHGIIWKVTHMTMAHKVASFFILACQTFQDFGLGFKFECIIWQGKVWSSNERRCFCDMFINFMILTSLRVQMLYKILHFGITFREGCLFSLK